MEIEFLKMQGCGEDVVLVEASRLVAGALERLPEVARLMLDRNYGVGGTALLVLGTVDDSLSVRCIDEDGDDSEPGCNGLRCAARYASDSGRVSTSDFTIAAGGRSNRVQIIDSANVRVDMGQPFDQEKSKQVLESTRDSYTRAIDVNGRQLTYTPISLSEPYAVFFVPDFSFPLRKTARAIAEVPDFPTGTGIGFLQVVSREEMRLRSWGDEGDPCACASAALVAAVVNGFTDREVFVRMSGGDVFLQWEESDNHIWLTGPAAYVFTGTYDHPEQPEGDA
jgi:diaminopimelate epimerase